MQGKKVGKGKAACSEGKMRFRTPSGWKKGGQGRGKPCVHAEKRAVLVKRNAHEPMLTKDREEMTCGR